MSKPAILTVDDDPMVSAAIARDLRSQYGADYRIVRAGSGEQALAMLTKLALRGQQIALIATDHDDRVVPAHSFKFAATLQEHQAADNPVLIRIETRAGHGAGTPTATDAASPSMAVAVSRQNQWRLAMATGLPGRPAAA